MPTTQAIARVGQLTDQIERQFGTLPTIAEGVGPGANIAGDLPVFRGRDGGRRPAACGDDKNRRPRCPSQGLMSAASRSPLPTDPIRYGSSTRCGSPPSSMRCGSR